MAELTEKQLAFCEAYGSLDSETYQKRAASYIVAGYAEKAAAQGASRLMHNPKIIKCLNEIYDQNVIEHKPRILSNFEYHRLKALAAGKYEAANNANKYMAQMMGFLKAEETSVTVEQGKLDDAEAAESRKIANLLNIEEARKGKMSAATLEATHRVEAFKETL